MADVPAPGAIPPPAPIPPAPIPPAPIPPAPIPPPVPPPPPPPLDPFLPLPPLPCPFPPVVPPPVPPPPPPLDLPPHLIAIAGGVDPALITELTVDVLLALLQACRSFEELFRVRTICPEVNNVFRLNTGSLLNLMGARLIRHSGARVTETCMQYATEILIFQRYQYLSRIPPQGRNSVLRTIYERVENERQPTLFMRITDIPQFRANHTFFVAFRKFYRGRLDNFTYTLNEHNPQRYARLKDESQIDLLNTHNTTLESIEFPVDSLLSVEDFYHAWVMTYRFKYEPITSFARRMSPVNPLLVGKIHFIAFLMDQFYMSQIPFNRRSNARAGAPNPAPLIERQNRKRRILSSWRKSCFMGVWYPLKTTDDGIFSMNFARGIWRKVTTPGGGLLGWSYFVSDLMGGFTPVNGAGGHLLYWKFLSELAARSYRTATADSKADGSWQDGFLALKTDFDLQFERRNIVQLMNRFGLEERGYVRNRDV